MRAKTIFFLTVGIMLLSVLPVIGADSTFEGEVGVTGKLTDVHGNDAKFNEYRDLKDGVYGGARLKYDTDDFFLKGTASDIGYDTQRYRVEGGMYGKFKAYLDYTEIPHHFTNNARTFYEGVGTNTLTYTTPPVVGTINPATWPSTFDYAIKRKTLGGGLKFDMLKPFFIDLSASREARTGIKQTSVAGTSPGGIVIELPEPVDYVTNIAKVEAGYAQKPFFAAVNFMFSNFDNANTLLLFQNPAAANAVQALTLPPNNEYYKLGFRGSVLLPLNSKFLVNLSTSKTTSETDLVAANLGVINGLSDNIFNGKVEIQNYNFVLTSNPVPFLNGKIFYKYYDRNNKSDLVAINDVSLNFPVSFHKNSAGVDLGFKLPANFYLNPAYTYTVVNRGRFDFVNLRLDLPETRDHIASVTLKWNGLNFIVPKVGYELLQRRADQPEPNTTDISRFDASGKLQATYKVGVEIYPMENLNFALEYKNKHEKFKGVTPIGLQRLQSDVFDFEVGYTLGRTAQLNAYVDYERINSFQFQTSAATPTEWGLEQKEKTINYGVAAEIYVIPRILTLILQHDYTRSDGFADFTAFTAPTAPRNNDNIDLSNWDNYRKTSYLAKVKYSPRKKYTFIAGYAYERYRYNDAQWDGYDITAVANATATSNRAYLTGAYANPNYQAHVVFLGASYKF